MDEMTREMKQFWTNLLEFDLHFLELFSSTAQGSTEIQTRLEITRVFKQKKRAKVQKQSQNDEKPKGLPSAQRWIWGRVGMLAGFACRSQTACILCNFKAKLRYMLLQMLLRQKMQGSIFLY